MRAENGHAKLLDKPKTWFVFVLQSVHEYMLVKCWNEDIKKQSPILEKKKCVPVCHMMVVELMRVIFGSG